MWAFVMTSGETDDAKEGIAIEAAMTAKQIKYCNFFLLSLSFLSHCELPFASLRTDEILPVPQLTQVKRVISRFRSNSVTELNKSEQVN